MTANILKQPLPEYIIALERENTALRAALLLARKAILKESAADEQIALNDIDQLLGAVAITAGERTGG